MADSVTYEIEKKLGVLSRSDNGWRKEVNLVSWNNGIVKMDIRDWDRENSKMRKGVTLTRSEVYTLFGILKHLDFGEVGDYANKGERSTKYTKQSSEDSAEAASENAADEDDILDGEYICDKQTENDEVPFEGIGSIVAESDDEIDAY